jgi:hypothetical protein
VYNQTINQSLDQKHLPSASGGLAQSPPQVKHNTSGSIIAVQPHNPAGIGAGCLPVLSCQKRPSWEHDSLLLACRHTVWCWCVPLQLQLGSICYGHSLAPSKHQGLNDGGPAGAVLQMSQHQEPALPAHVQVCPPPPPAPYIIAVYLVVGSVCGGDAQVPPHAGVSSVRCISVI